MLEGENILCFSPDPWGSIWPDKSQIMSILARRNRVLYVEPELHFRPTLRKVARGEIGSSHLWRRRVSWIQDGLYVYHPPVFAPISGHVLLGPITQALRFGLLRRTLRHLEMSEPILWLFRPGMVDLVGQFGEKLLIYHIVDEYSAYSKQTPELARWTREREARLASQADIIFVTSQALWKTKRQLNPRTYLMQNGVDYGTFARIIASDTSLPTDISSLQRPVIGFVGSICHKQDYELLRLIAGSHSAWSLVMIGPVRGMQNTEELKQLQSSPNVHFLGCKPTEEIPQYINACDVCLIPYVDSEETRNINPLKLYEYFACGKPVVSVDIPSVRPFAEVVYIARDRETFIKCIEEALREDGSLTSRRFGIAKQNTWEARVEQLSTLIQETLRVKYSTEGPNSAHGGEG